MLDKAIEMIQKQVSIDKVQKDNIITRPKERSLEASIKRKINKKIQIEEYVLEILYKQKKEENNE